MTSLAIKLYREIDRQINEKGYCIATSKYLAEQLNVSVSTIQSKLKELKNLNKIYTSYYYDSLSECRRRCINKN